MCAAQNEPHSVRGTLGVYILAYLQAAFLLVARKAINKFCHNLINAT
jgi:hypothetical protein